MDPLTLPIINILLTIAYIMSCMVATLGLSEYYKTRVTWLYVAASLSWPFWIFIPIGYGIGYFVFNIAWLFKKPKQLM